MALVNAKEMLKKAKQEKYAIPHININNLEWAKAILLTAEAEKSPIIICTSEGAIKYMGGFEVVSGMVLGLINDLNITVPVSLHLDHGSYAGAKKAIETDGYTSLMFDGSHLAFEENYTKTSELLALVKIRICHSKLKLEQLVVKKMVLLVMENLLIQKKLKKWRQLGIDVLAAGIGNIHSHTQQIENH
ncbi:class II fructose-bisphosphate aldolase [Mycoplasmopsis cynos]|uniref:class II fructose-bisphosphate aldolase n=1 Tax=Mycoplasmopsis cynos TaxID=171284 RepID=UPI0024CC37C1|nr:class II fructose-bisphosphate aldolase [Mycoplasmopsis cynos]WAM03923.1 class II fructose-bisphosphate aldolase [Mycoplasmopsis cynos]